MSNQLRNHERIGAIVMAAGQSRRMGRPKMTLPWGATTVIGQVVATLLACELEPVIVVTGGNANLVRGALEHFPVLFAHNERFQETEMLQSLQVGIELLPTDVEAVLIVLGDQPQITERVIKAILERHRVKKSKLIVPSYQMRRGHPWLIIRSFLPEIAALKENETLRTFLVQHADQIDYLLVDTPTILADLDTPAEYDDQKPD